MSFLDKIKGKLPFEVGKTGESKPSVPSKKEAKLEKPATAKLAKPTSAKPKLEPAPAKPPKKAGLSSIMKSAIKTEEKTTVNPLLEAPPELDDELLEGVEPPKSITLYVLKGFFMFLVAIGLGSLLFFTSQLTDYLDFATNAFNFPTILDELDRTNDEIKELKTDLNMHRYLQGKFHLDQFSYDGDEYLRNFYIYSNKTMSEEERAAAYAEMTSLRKKLAESFQAASMKLTKDLGQVMVTLEVEDDDGFEKIFVELLSTRFKTKLSELEDSENEPDKRDHKLYKQSQRLVSNKDLLGLMRTSDLDALTDGELADLILEVNDLIENELSAIQKIKESRINWSDIINQIELETTYVDQYFSGGYFDEVGGIQYTNFDFNSSTGKLSITGITKTLDTNNFTLISNLIDQLNESPYFKNVEMRSFTKSGSAEEGYTATLRLNLELQKEALHSADEPISLEELPEFLNPGIGIPLEEVEPEPESELELELESDEAEAEAGTEVEDEAGEEVPVNETN